jgi:hypothetical protein
MRNYRPFKGPIILKCTDRYLVMGLFFHPDGATVIPWMASLPGLLAALWQKEGLEGKAGWTRPKEDREGSFSKCPFLSLDAFRSRLAKISRVSTRFNYSTLPPEGPKGPKSSNRISMNILT